MMHNRRTLLLTAIILYCATVLMADFVTPMGIEMWVLNLPVILVPILIRNRRMVIGVALLCSAMLLAGGVISPPGGNPPLWDVLNRAMGLGAMWVIAVMAT